MTSIKEKATLGVKWNSVSQFGRQGIQIISTVVLARLLPPSDFGLLGMAMVIIGFIEIFKDLGTTVAIIQKKDLTDTLLSSVFWINVGFGALVTAILFLGAPLGGMLFNESRVVGVLKLLSVNFFISGLSILHQALLEKTLAFGTLAKVEIGAAVCGAIVGVTLALTSKGVWSLVFQSLTTVTITTLFLWIVSSWRPQMIFAWHEVKPITKFSLNLVGFNIFNYFSRNADYLLIGRYLGAQDLGFYTLAYNILLFPIQSISNVLRRVMLPLYSSIQNDNHRFSNAYLKVAGTIALITFPMMMGVLALAKPFIIVFFGENWQPVNPLIMILSPVGMIQSIGTMTGTIYQAKGRTDWMLLWGVGAGLIYIATFIIGLQWGIVGVSAAYAIAVFSLSYFNQAIPFRLIDLNFIRLIQVLKKPFLNSLTMFLAVMLFLNFHSYGLPDELILVASIGIGITTYAVINWLTNRGQLQELWSLIWSRSQSI